MSDTNQFVALIGTCFMDIKGFSASTYDPLGRNLGCIEYYNGGVARNVAMNCGNIGTPTRFISLLDKGVQGDKLIEELSSCGTDTKYVYRTDFGGTGVWMAILDEKGNLAGSISQPPTLEVLFSHIAANIDEAISGCKAILLEMDLSETIAEYAFSAAEKASIPVYVIVGNLSVILARPDLLKRCSCFICNEREAEKIFHVDYSCSLREEILFSMKNCMKTVGIPSMVITLGDKGSVFCDNVSEGICEPVLSDVIDTTGAGDAFFSACSCALIDGKPLSEAAALGSKLASAVISRRENYYASNN